MVEFQRFFFSSNTERTDNQNYLPKNVENEISQKKLHRMKVPDSKHFEMTMQKSGITKFSTFDDVSRRHLMC